MMSHIKLGFLRRLKIIVILLAGFNYTSLVLIFGSKLSKGLLWSWSYGSWIYNYLCIRCLSPLMLWVRFPLRARSTTLSDKVCQWLAAGRWFPPPIKLTATI